MDPASDLPPLQGRISQLNSLQEKTLDSESRRYPWGNRGQERYPVKDPVTYTDLERRYPPDKFGHEADDDARVWRLYKAGATDKEDDRVNKLRKTIDSLPVFAGLFSAVQTAFIIEGAKQLQPDFTEYQIRAFYAVHRANNSGFSGLEASYDPETFAVPVSARCANSLWLGSLVLSLFVALHAIVAQQWLEDYSFRINEPTANHRRWVWRHLVFSAGFERWKIDAFISALPLVLHLSLLMFFVGLVLFLLPIDLVAASVIIGAAGIGAIFYLIVTFIPVIWPDCPTATPLLRLVLYIYHSIMPDDREKPRDAEISHPGDTHNAGTGKKATLLTEEDVLMNRRRPFDLDIDALCWMIKYLPAVDEVNAALDAVSALSPGPNYLSNISPDRGHRFVEINRVLERRVDALSVGIASPEPAAIARTLRTSVALAAVNRHLNLPSPLRGFSSQLLHWRESIPQYDVFWLCQILVCLAELPGHHGVCVDMVAAWYLEGWIAHPERACLPSTRSILLDWHFAGSQGHDSQAVEKTRVILLDILRAFFCINTVHAVADGVWRAEMLVNQHLLDLCSTRNGNERRRLSLSNGPSHAVAVVLSLPDALQLDTPDQQSQIFRLCSDLVDKLRIVPEQLQPLQRAELDPLLKLARQAYGGIDGTESELLKRVLRTLENLFSRGLATTDNWTTEVGELLGMALNALLRELRGSDAASVLAMLPVVHHPDCSSVAATIGSLHATENIPRLGLLKSGTLRSTWRLIIIAANDSYPWTAPWPCSLTLLALELIIALPYSVRESSSRTQEDRLQLTSTEALNELLGTPEDPLPFITLLKTEETATIVQIMLHAKDLNPHWYSQFVAGVDRTRDGWVEFYGKELFARVAAAPSCLVCQPQVEAFRQATTVLGVSSPISPLEELPYELDDSRPMAHSLPPFKDFLRSLNVALGIEPLPHEPKFDLLPGIGTLEPVPIREIMLGTPLETLD